MGKARTRLADLKKLEDKLIKNISSRVDVFQRIAATTYPQYRLLLKELNRGENVDIYDNYHEFCQHSKSAMALLGIDIEKYPSSRLLPVIPNAVRDMPFNLHPIKSQQQLREAEERRTQESPLIELNAVQRELDYVHNFYIPFWLFDGVAREFMDKKATSAGYLYLEMARANYNSLNMFQNNSGNNPLINRAMKALRRAYPILFKKLEKPIKRRK
jgi:hypothetical protein